MRAPIVHVTDNSIPSISDPEGRNWRVLVALSLLVLAIAGPVKHDWGGTQQASRYLFSAALWDDHTVVLDGYTHLLGRDHALREGSIYSDKAPGQPFFGALFYGVYRVVGGEPAAGARSDPDIGLWWVTLWSATIPAAALAVLMYLWAKEVEPRSALAVALMLTLGSMLFVYSTLLFGHALAATLAAAMYLIVRRAGASGPMLVVAGLLGGSAVLVEYPVALILVIITGAAFTMHRWRATLVLLGGIPPAILLAIYNNATFGSPTTLSYQWVSWANPLNEARTTFDMFDGPSIDRFLHLLFSQRGLFVATPIVVIGLMGLVPLWKRGFRVDAAVVGLSVCAMLFVQGSWGNSFAGGAGPRYLVPALPFLVAPLAISWTRWPRVSAAMSAISVLTMTAATFSDPQLPSDFDAGLGYWLKSIAAGDVAPTLWTRGLGGFGWLVHGLTVLCAAGALWRVSSRRAPAATVHLQSELLSVPN